MLVIGAGLSGLVAACQLAQAGLPTRLVAKGAGGLALSQGTIDLMGYPPAGAALANPFDFISAPPPGHPYAAIGPANVRRGVQALLDLLGPDWMQGDLEANAVLPTALGALRPTALYPGSLAAGRPQAGARWAVVGFDRVKDFSPALAAGNWNRAELPGGGRLHATPHLLELPPSPVLGGLDASAMAVARAFDQPGFSQRVAEALRPAAKAADAVALPAVLGAAGQGVWRELGQELGKPVFEVGLPPPCLPGHRLAQTLTQRARELGVRLVFGAAVTGFQAAGGRVVEVTAAAAGAPKRYPVDAIVYCPGGFESGAIALDSRYHLAETLFKLPLANLAPIEQLIGEEYGEAPAVFRVGVRVDAQMRPLDQGGEPVYQNLRVAGGLLGGAVRWAEKSGEGVALGSAWAAVESVLRSVP
ncbi:MAG: glycerol-3-phosphate dehydrogenase subunit GlpB [Bifidobacteriaceae bacterium]|jgi:glycerol-3-phosphate dehydrogenase subunit B|nr:glycerol-3-phosphate dehydrogenase subunit GlpB [Bifidobacteriaceae bacterium]